MNQLKRFVAVDGSDTVGVGERPIVDEAVVAAGAFEIHAEEDLRDVLRGLHRREHRGVDDATPNDATGERLAGFIARTYQFGNELIVRFVGYERLVKPARNLAAATIDEAGAFIVVAEVVV